MLLIYNRYDAYENHIECSEPNKGQGHEDVGFAVFTKIGLWRRTHSSEHACSHMIFFSSRPEELQGSSISLSGNIWPTDSLFMRSPISLTYRGIGTHDFASLTVDHWALESQIPNALVNANLFPYLSELLLSQFFYSRFHALWFSDPRYPMQRVETDLDFWP